MEAQRSWLRTNFIVSRVLFLLPPKKIPEDVSSLAERRRGNGLVCKFLPSILTYPPSFPAQWDSSVQCLEQYRHEGWLMAGAGVRAEVRAEREGSP